MDKIKVVYKQVDDLIPYARNSRLHSDSQVQQIAQSITLFGFNNPVLLDGENGIIAGHGRVMAAQKLGMKSVPTIELSHLDENQKKAYIIADNKLALNASWDEKMLVSELEDLEEAGFDTSATGFDDVELNDILEKKAAEAEALEYSKKIDTPIYTPKGEKPELSALFEEMKVDSLLKKIHESNVTLEEKTFLCDAAQRHRVFDYHLIAEYYCHASKEMQELMEDSALVIIDFNKAVENGYVVMTRQLQDIYADTYAGGDDDDEE